MAISDRWSDSDPDILVQERLAKLEKANQELSRRNLALEGINRILSIAVQDKTEEEFGNECLSVALEVTGSQLGFVNLVGDDGLLHDIAISDMGWKECLMYDKTGHRRPPGNFLVHGLYGHVIHSEKSFFTNDPMSHPDSVGIPDGHPLLTSFLGVPLSLDGKVVGMLGVANREGGYKQEQQADLEAITPAIIQSLHKIKSELRRKLLEKKASESRKLFTAFMDNSPVIAWMKNEQGRYVYLNKIHENRFNVWLKDWKGKTDFEVWPLKTA